MQDITRQQQWLARLEPDLRDLGQQIIAMRERGLRISQKQDQSPVTDADHLADRELQKILQATHPFPVISEESYVPDKALPDAYWCVDPIDSTKNFISGGDAFSINIALIENSKPIFGILFFPAQNLLAAGGRDLVARQIDGKGHLRELKASLVATGNLRLVVSSPGQGRMERLAPYLPSDHSIVAVKRLDGAGKFLHIASGAADLYPRLTHLSEWDLAAGHAIIEAAGGEVTTTTGAEINYGQRLDLRCPHFLAWGKKS